MKLDDFVTIRHLVVGTATTTVGATASLAGDMAAQVAHAEPSWLNVAIKFATLGAGLVTMAAGAIRVWLDCRKDARETKAAQQQPDAIND
jgi:hypothetical protein